MNLLDEPIKNNKIEKVNIFIIYFLILLSLFFSYYEKYLWVIWTLSTSSLYICTNLILLALEQINDSIRSNR